MSKRLTATEKWKNPWFCSLSPKDKLFWVYIVDNCDHAGIWQVNWSLVKFHIKGFRFNPETFKDRIFEISPTKWYIPKFVPFQYGALNPANKVHASVLNILEKEGARQGLGSPWAGAKDKEKDKDKVKDKVKDVDVVRHLDFVLLKPDEFQKLKDTLGTLVDSYIERLNGWIGQTGAEGKYKSHYHTILNWHRKDIAGGKNGTNDSKGAHHISSPKERIGSLGKTPAELRIILDRAKSEELPARMRNHAMAPAGESQQSPVEHGRIKPHGE